MTDPNNELEARLRDHLAERAERVDVTRGTSLVDNAPAGPWTRARVPAAVAAAVALLAGAVAVLATRDDRAVTAGSTLAEGSVSSSTTGSTTSPGMVDPEGPTRETVVVMGRDGLVGWWDGSSWQSWDGAKDRDRTGAGLPAVPVGEEFRVFALDEPILPRKARQGESCAYGNTAPLDRTIDMVRRGVGFAKYDPIAITGSHDPRPRPVSVLAPHARNSFKRQAREVLADLRLDDDDPPIQQAIRADLDGDGTAEFVIVTERAWDRNRTYNEGDVFYSVVFVSRGSEEKGGELVSASFEKVNSVDPGLTYFLESTVSALVDTNGDGRMEIAADFSYYEGQGVTVFAETPTGKWTEVMGYGCGA